MTNPYPEQASHPAPVAATTIKPSSGIAIAALVVGIVAFISGLAPVWGLIAGAAAVGLGILALVKRQNKVLAIIGAALGGIAFITSLITTLALAAVITNSQPSTVPPPTVSETATEPSEMPTEAAPVEPSETVSQTNAVRSANSYLATMAFSRTGLIEQLVFEGYSDADATYAVDAVGADWNEQAVAAAKSYLDTMPFSHSGLVDQLVFGGFTPEQAEYGVTANGL